jgi:hypothetical protein
VEDSSTAAHTPERLRKELIQVGNDAVITLDILENKSADNQ